ncbi:MAG: DotU family type IV/VI secretion system protein [Deltaproteobacteria bacterium]|nr:DotU family type IV/VI secretion system protein [Deltaproteobacteria bacterium]
MKEDYVALHTDLIAYVLTWANSYRNKPSDYVTVRGRIKSLLEIQMEFVAREGYSVDNYKQTRFAVCAWIDELIMNSLWDHRQEWQKDLLQSEYYRTTNAGEEFFERLAEIHPEQKPVREIFHICLCLGFRGRFVWDDEQPKLKTFIRQNYSQLPAPLIEVRDLGLEKIMPAAYEGKLDLARTSPKEQGRTWLKLALGLAGPPIALAIGFYVYRFILGNILNGIIS